MSYEFYKVVHVVGILMLFAGLSALWGVYSTGHAPKKSLRMALAIIHGVGMALILVSGFGQLARLGMTNGMPTWALTKLGIWLLLGGSMVLAKRRAQMGPVLIGIWVALGGTAAWLAIYKPF